MEQSLAMAAGSRRAAANPIYNATVTTKMMQDYRVEDPVRSMSHLALLWNEAAELDVMAIGADRHLHHLYRSPSSLTGWDHHALPIKALDVRVLYTANRPDRSFVMGNVDGGTSGLLELKRGSGGQYTSTFLGLGLGDQSLDVFPCSGDVASVCTSGPQAGFYNIVSGVFPQDTTFVAYQGNNPVKGTKVAAVPYASTKPHLALVVLLDGTLNAYRGVRLQALSAAEAAQLPEPAPNYSFSHLEVETAALPPLPGVRDFALVSTGTQAVSLLAVDGSHQLHVLRGAIDAAQPGVVQWGSAWSHLELTGPARPSFAGVCSVQLPNGRTRVLLHEALTHQLWITSWSGSDLATWNSAINLGVGAPWFAASVSHREEMSFATASPEQGIHAWSRTSSGDWRCEDVHLPSGAEVQMRKARAVCLNVSDAENANPGKLTLNVRASEDMTVTINGVSCAIGADKPAAVTTGSGMVRVQGIILNSLHTPKLSFEADWLAGGRLEVQADDDVRGFLKVVTGQQLFDAVDPFTGQPLLQGSHRTMDDADSLAQALRQIADLPVSTSSPRSARKRAKATAWRFHRSGERLQFDKLSAAAAQTAAKVAAASPNDVWDDLGSALLSLWNDATEVLEILFDDGVAVVKFLVNGVETVLRFAVEKLEQLYDLVAAAFDVAGTQMGSVVGWLMDKIGAIFGWDGIKAERDMLRGKISTALAQFKQNVPDPAAFEAPLRQKLQEARTQIHSWIEEIRQQPIGAHSFRQNIGPVPALSSLFEADGDSFFPQGTWLIDKAVEALRGSETVLPAPQIPGLAVVLESLLQHARDAAAIIAALAAEMAAGSPYSWATNLDSFRGDTIIGLIELVAGKVEDLVRVIDAALHDIITALHLGWEYMAEIVAWFDREIYLPFVSAFYEQVIGSKLSLLDLACLCVAIPLSMDADTSDTPTAKKLISYTMRVWAVMHTLAEFTYVAGREVVGTIFLTFSSLMLFIVGMDLASFDEELQWQIVGRLMLGLTVFDLMLRWSQYYGAMIGLGIGAFGLGIPLAAMLQPPAAPTVAVFLLLLSSTVHGLLGLWGEQIRRSPQLIAGYSAFQCLSALGVWATYEAGRAVPA